MNDIRPASIHPPRPSRRRLATELATLALIVLAGCGDSRPTDASPVVAPDSEPAVRAIAEREAMIQDRAQQEAKARRNRPVLPIDG